MQLKKSAACVALHAEEKGERKVISGDQLARLFKMNTYRRKRGEKKRVLRGSRREKGDFRRSTRTQLQNKFQI